MRGDIGIVRAGGIIPLPGIFRTVGHFGFGAVRKSHADKIEASGGEGTTKNLSSKSRYSRNLFAKRYNWGRYVLGELWSQVNN